MSATIADERRASGVESTRRVLNILLQFDEGKPTLSTSEIMASQHLSQTTAYRYISLLRELRFLRQVSPGEYALGRSAFRLASAADDSDILRAVAEPILADLSTAFNETAFLMRRQGSEAVFVASSQPNRALTLSFRQGTRSVLHRGAVAKVLLAFSPQAFREDYLDKNVVEPDARKSLEKQLALIESTGYAESHEEVDEGIWGGAVPVVIEGRLAASLSVAGPIYRLPDATRTQITDRLRSESLRISQEVYRLEQAEG